MKDRFVQGFLAGIAGWLPEAIFTMTMYYAFHSLKLRYLDFAAIFSLNHLPHGLIQIIFSELVVIIFLGTLGAFFGMIMKKSVTSSNTILRGFLFGTNTWFLIYSIITLYKVEGIYKKIDFMTAFISLVAGAIWGISTAWIFLLLSRKYNE